MRLFIASFFEKAFVETLAEISAYARANAGRGSVKWVEQDNFHLTYAFLGEVEQDAVAAAVKSVEAALDGLKAFTVSSGVLGAFPFSRNPRVLWLGLGGGVAALREIAGRLGAELSRRGLPAEGSFEPHITLGRVKKPLPEFFFRRIAEYAASRKAGSSVDSVDVMRSSPGSNGPVYTRIYSRRLL